MATVVIDRMRNHSPTKAYVARRCAEARSIKEIVRSLDRYITRQLCRTLAAAHPTQANPRHPLKVVAYVESATHSRCGATE